MILVPNCSQNRELFGEGPHPLQLHLHRPRRALSHPLQVVEGNSAVKTLNKITWNAAFLISVRNEVKDVHC